MQIACKPNKKASDGEFSLSGAFLRERRSTFAGAHDVSGVHVKGHSGIKKHRRVGGGSKGLARFGVQLVYTEALPCFAGGNDFGRVFLRDLVSLNEFV